HIAHLVAADSVDQLPKGRKAPGKVGKGVGIADARTDGYGAVRLRNGAQLFQVSDEDGGRNVAHEFRDPQADVGRPCHNGGIWLRFEYGSKVIEVCGNDETLATAANLHAGPISHCLERGNDRL